MCFSFKVGLWDFSVGAVVTLSAIVGGSLAVTYHLGIVGLIVISVLCALLCSTITGGIFAVLKIPSIVVSIGMLLIYETAASTLFNAAGASIPSEMSNMTVLAETPQIFIVGLIAIVGAIIIYNFTGFGYHVKAVGSDANIAQSTGVNVLKTRFFGFVISGIFLGIAAMLTISLKGTIKPAVSMSTMSLAFDAIMALFLGMYLSKFCGMIPGVLLGGITMRIIASGLLTLGLTSSLQDVVKGVMMIFFISLASTGSGFSDVMHKLKLKRKSAEYKPKQQNV